MPDVIESFQVTKQTVQQKYGGSSFASGEGWKPYSHSLAGN